jgi:hypothetical protein
MKVELAYRLRQLIYTPILSFMLAPITLQPMERDPVFTTTFQSPRQQSQKHSLFLAQDLERIRRVNDISIRIGE